MSGSAPNEASHSCDVGVQDVTRARCQDVGIWIWRCLCGLMAVFFAGAAYLQHNDPDLEIWMVVYGVPCLLCCTVVLYPKVLDSIIWTTVVLMHMVGCICGLIYISVTTSDKLAKHKKNLLDLEEGREVCGLALTIAWLGLSLLVATRRLMKNRSCPCNKLTSSSRDNTIPVRVSFVDGCRLEVA